MVGRVTRTLPWAVIAFVLVVCALGAWGQVNYDYVYPVANFQSYILPGGDATRSDRYFTSTGFYGLTFTMNTSNIGHFRDGQLRWDAYGSNPARTFGWTDRVPVDLGSTDNQPWDPDRPDFGTPFSGESDNPRWATLQEVFEGNIVNRVMDGEASIANAYLTLYFGNGSYIQSDGNAQTPELVLLERGANSAVYVRAIRSDYTYSNTIAVNFRVGTGTNYDPLTGINVPQRGGNTDFSVNTMEIGAAQAVSGVGIDLMAFGNISTSDRVIGYEIWFQTNTFCDGPDLHSFILSKPPTPVPEASTLAALMTFLGGGAAFLRRRAVPSRS